ncbi:conserved exported hypothetical protein [Candidatus Terasakiella magnetica]|nr:conserved exported hypothetical protein [Candidatus Terasakiella magnetica]
MILRPLPLALTIIALAGCASTTVPWRHSQLSQDQWGRDYSACRRMGERDSGWREENNSSASPFREYDRQQAKKVADASISACMRDLGYVPAVKK